MVVALVVASGAVTAATPVHDAFSGSTVGTGADTANDPPGDSIRDQIETDNVRLTVGVLPNGSAEWTVEYETVLEDDNTTEAFESLRADIRDDRSAYVQRFADRIRNTVDSAENATGREMRATDFSVETRVEQVSCPSANGCGIISYSFRWDGFASVEDGGDRLVIGDAIEGFFLDDNTRLEIGWPEDYAAVEVSPDPDGSSSSAVLWRGSGTEFVSGEPSVVVERGGTTTAGGTNDGGTDTTTATTTTAPGGTDESGGFPILPVLVGGLVVLVLGGGLVWWRTNADDDPGPAAAEAGGDGGTPGGTTADEGDGSGGDAEDEPFDIDQELLSNEEQVIKLLEANGGRLKQQEVISELDWTEAKTSQVISGMREDGSVDTFRLGRENVVTLPDEDIGVDPEGQEGE
jgi:hypothetical protein